MTELVPLRVLVVEDDNLVRQLLLRAARSICQDVTAAEGGSQAMQLLQQQHFDVVVSDLKMPGVSGLDVLRYAREKQPSARLLAISGYVDADDEDAIQQLGAIVLAKPFGFAQLRSALEDAVRVER
jgi:CheY-like chemotaxis protein